MRPMMMTKAAVILLLSSVAAGASDMSDPYAYDGAAASVSGTDWTGLYAGATLGYGLGEISFGDIEGGTIGLTLGHNWQNGQLVFGVEGDVSYSGIDRRSFAGDYDIDWVGTVRGRIGYAFDRFVAYGTAGIAWVNAEYRGPSRDDQNHLGLTVGVGAEMRLTDEISAKAEYLYIDSADETYDGGPDRNIDPDIHLLRVGLNYRF